MFINKFLLNTVAILFILISYSISHSMGANTNLNTKLNVNFENAEESNITLKELADIYWPDSKSTNLQQEETLKNILYKKVTWDITVAQIQRENDIYIIQGQSDKNMIRTFSYITPENDKQKDMIIKTSIGSIIKITGIVQDMKLRHIVLNPSIINEI